MSSPLRGGLATLLVAFLGGGVALSCLGPLDASKRALKAPSLPLYVPSGRAARIVSLGHASTMADLLYLWSIQHFSEPAVDRDLRRAWLERVYGTITDLDPRFRDAYWLGYVSLLVEGKDVDAAFRLVDKALEHDPQFTMLAIEAALTAHKEERPEDGLRYLRQAAAAGDRLAMRLALRLQEAETAQDELAAWLELADDPDPQTQYIAAAHVRDLTMLIESATLSALAQCYRREHGGLPPGSLAQLQKAGWVRQVPLDPDGRPYAYHPATATVVPASPYRYRPPSKSRRGVDLSALGACDPARAAP